MGMSARAAGLSDVIDEIAEKIAHDETPQSLSVDEILDAVGRRSYGPLLLLIGLFSISPLTLLPGMNWATAAVALLIAGQMALGFKQPWTPKKLREMSMPPQQVTAALAQLRPWAKRVDAVLKPRLTFLAAPPFVNLVALACVAAALVTFPLGLIPAGPVAPGLAIVFFGLGMTAHDGLWLMAGGLFLGLAAAFATHLIL